MAGVTRNETFNAPIEKVFEAISDFAGYADFVSGVTSVNVIEKTETHAKVEFSLNLIKKFSYTLDLKLEAPSKMTWTFDSGDIFKSNSGSWELSDNGDGTTNVDYALDVSFKLFVPKAIANTLTEKNLPTMMKEYHDRAKSL